jgi:hypothetical protein
MPLVPLDLRPGVFKNGTAYGQRGRWSDSNLVRWKDNAIRPVGGWERRIKSDSTPIAALWADPTTEAARNILSWTANDGSRHLVIGTNEALYHVSASGTVTDISYSGFVGGNKDSGVLSGYGVGAYGVGAYGTPRTGEGLVSTPVASWSLDLWGEDLIAVFRSDGERVYKWKPNVDATLIELTTTPQDFQGVVVTDERILLGIKATERLVQWSDSEDRTEWTPDATNQSGSLTLAGNGPLIGLCKVLNTILVLGANDAYAGRYLGPPFIYGFERVSDSCGLMAANALVASDTFAMWPCGRNMWSFNGAQVQQVRSDVVDFFIRDLNQNERSKTYGFQIRDFHEIWWLYQSVNSTTTEPDSYICYDYQQDHWTKGKLNRTVGADRSAALRNPLMVSPEGLLFNHELRNVSITTGPIPFCETAPVEIGQGDQQTFVDYIYPDAERAANLQARFKAADMPQDTKRDYGPFSMANPVPVRVRGRQIQVRFEGRDPDWAVGSMRLNIKPGGRK